MNGQPVTWTVVRAGDVRPGDVLSGTGPVTRVDARAHRVPRWRLTGEDPCATGGMALGEEDLVVTGVISIEITGADGKTAEYAEDSQVRVRRPAGPRPDSP